MPNVITPVGSPVEKLKNVFGTGQVPLASNFSDFIDVADVGRKAAGLSPDQPQGQGLGLQLDENLKLALLPQAAGGINVNATGIGVTVEAGQGLSVGANGMALVIEANKGIVVGMNGLAIQPSNGINVSNTGVGITTEAGKGLTVGANGLAIQPGNGIDFSPAGLEVKVDATKGLMVGSSGVGAIVNTASGVKVDENGIGLSDDLYIKIFCALHSAQFYGVSDYVAVFIAKSAEGYTCAYFYGRNGAIPMKDDEFVFTLNGVKPGQLQFSRDSGYANDYSQVFSATWPGLTVSANDQISVPFILGDLYGRGASTILLQAV